MMVEIKRDLKIISDAVFEFFAKIENIVGAMLFFPARCHPLLEFPVAFRQQVGGVSPREDCFVRARN